MAVSGVRYSAIFLLLAACGTQYTDPIRVTADEPADPCTAWTTQVECVADTAHGCSFQPNTAGCKLAEASCSAGTCRGGDPFVRRSGQALWLHDAPYRFLGAVSWGIGWDPDGCRVYSLPDQDQALAQAFDDFVDMRVSVLKFWAFQSYAGASGSDYSSFERVVVAARRAGVRLIFVLENHWQSCTPSARDDAWYAGGYDSADADYALSYADYVSGVVEHFRTEPTILAWELMHEARGDDFASLDTFAREASALVRRHDPNHLIVLGIDNGDSPATDRTGTPSNHQRLHDHPDIDLIDVHDFSESDEPLTSSSEAVTAIASALQKPIFAGATAVAVADASPAELERRAGVVADKIEAAFGAGFAGYLGYDYYPYWDTPGWEFDGRPEEPLAGSDGVFATHAPAAR